MSVFALIIVFCLLGGLLSVFAAALLLLVPERRRMAGLPHLVSFAIGALLGAAFLVLLPHALEGRSLQGLHRLTLVLLLGLLGFFVLEKILLWRHCHSTHCEAHTPEPGEPVQPTGALILVGDAIHNFVDGVLIAAAFLTDVHLGVITSIAVAAHEIPQEIGDFAILLHSGFTRARAFFWNAVSSLTTVAGGVLAYFSLADAQRLLPYVLAIAAASFIYVAVADLIPGLHRRSQFTETLKQVSLIGLGVVVIYGAHALVH